MGQRTRAIHVRIYHASASMSGVLTMSAHDGVSSVLRSPDEVVEVSDSAELEALVARYPDYLVSFLGQMESASSIEAGSIFRRLAGS